MDDLLSKYLRQKYQIDNDELKDLEQTGADNQTNNNLGRAASTAIAAIGGQKPDTSFYDTLDAQDQRRLADTKTDRKSVTDYLLQKYKLDREDSELTRKQAADKETARHHEAEEKASIANADATHQLKQATLDATNNNRIETRADRKEKEARVSDKQLENVNDFDSAISNAQQLLDTYKPEYTGPMDQYKSLPLVKSFSNPDAVAYQSKIGRLSDVYRKAVTGAAAADKELQRIESRLPQTNDTPETFKTKAQAFIKEMQAAKGRYLENLKGQGKHVDQYTGGNTTEAPPAQEKIIGGVKYRKVPGGWEPVE
jgi:hypothetical protein